MWKRKKPAPEMEQLDATFEQTELEIGNLVGNRYLLESVIYEGGMGKIFLAHHRDRNIKVAVKTIRLDMLEDTTKQVYNRFRREARGMALLQHPNIVRILGCDLSDKKQAYIVMEYVEGETLWDFMSGHRKGVLLHCFLQIIAQLCSAFHLVHKKGIIHRDIKPNNIMISAKGPKYTVKLLDMGLILFEKAFSVTSNLKLTKQGQLVGTPAYMSPEQCRGDSVTHLSDIYSLGLLAWEMLVGRPAFEGKNPMDLFTKQLKEMPKPVHTIRTNIPPKISEAIQATLDKNPANRPQSAKELWQSLHF
ncbi:MAG: serine/threonine-protein kinase [Acidobacteriota bacterium]|nr:serine/threonine-protein kinase [Acidobacteriota bacterium]